MAVQVGFSHPKSSGTQFPPSTATLSGLFAAHYTETPEQLRDLQLAGAFWAWSENLQNFYVPTPFNYVVTEGAIVARIVRKQDQWHSETTVSKVDRNTWIAIQDWSNPTTAHQSPWEYLLHLHPRLRQDERRVAVDEEQGSLFLENAIQMHPEVCLVYLSNTAIAEGRYRFGGEGHLASVKCLEIASETLDLLRQPVGSSFALITPAVWGSNRLSYRHPLSQQNKDETVWNIEALLTERPTPFRYRFGNRKDEHDLDIHQPHQPKLLSRGRYAVPAGSVYVLSHDLPAWQDWDLDWFPKEGVSLKRWGCGLSLPLSIV
ncbi:MAG: type III-B CRISPR module-associated protein Cmr3 [Plectolyngbya sp. WJT66-NPBG17]|jgi:CRISPR-associated protein Cmr3|nr:type III-B CRISPR module-associated protein Cmr3 [Plectolyngbya sp. WJT66-NPBG17]